MHERDNGVSMWYSEGAETAEPRSMPRMSQSATDDPTSAPPVSLPLEVDFQGGRLTRDGGWYWVNPG